MLGLRGVPIGLVKSTGRQLFSRNQRLISNTLVLSRLNSSLTQHEKVVAFSTEQLKEARETRLKGLGPYVSKLPAKLIPYAELMRLEKPVGTWLLYIPCTWSITMAATQTMAPVSSTLWTLFLFGAGALIMRGAGCTINDLLDRNLDNKVIRSVERPIASGRITPGKAVAFLGAQTAAGMGILSQLPAECWWLGLSSLPLVFTYPLFKRFTYYPQVVLSACFTWGALLGFPAMGVIDWSVMIPLYTSSFLWCMTYDTIYAHQDKKFDIKAGIKSTALAWGDKSRKICTLMSVAQMGALGTAGITSGLFMGPGFLAGMAIFGYRLFSMVRTVDLDNPADCWKHFTSNIRSGLIFSGALLVDYFLAIMGLL
ncbi:LANO_0A01112g1_1 [Lachancea nothofagi CBS 11611]|uniref:4-hydroxybenzoate polyprenyltransferase, mitochondrial n=1 Tax=Lachancea nothofagi CBS 11611 TaxID=1266666 RepID=A0A1G4IMB7_9SACH|nr:LANO_0A01112g1_1 [Lachancea nothofagi CBS 11611]